MKGTQEAGHKLGLTEDCGDFAGVDLAVFLPNYSKLSQQFSSFKLHKNQVVGGRYGWKGCALG